MSPAIDPVVEAADVPVGAVLVDVRFYLDGRDGREAFAAGHLPGARYLDLDAVLAGPPGGIAGRHPLPDPERFADGLGAVGVAADDTVVAYDDAGGVAASRLVWMLRVLGHEAALLNGGLAAAAGPLETGWPHVTAVARNPETWPEEAFADADAVERAVSAGTVVADSRSAARFGGAAHPLDTASGHVPGAVSVPYELAAPGGRFADPETLRDRLAAAGVDDSTIFYCGSGVSACVNLLAAERAGLGRPRLFVASWSGWTADPSRPVDAGR